jgi:acyl-CoA thioesterase FadM
MKFEGNFGCPQNFFMPRVLITPETNYPFTTEIATRIQDVNYGGHVGNDSILSIIHEIRIRFLEHYGYSELNTGEPNGALIMADIAMQYKNECYRGDVIVAHVTVSNWSKKSFELNYHLQTLRNNILVTIALATTNMVCFNYSTKTVMNVPIEFQSKLSKS